MGGGDSAAARVEAESALASAPGDVTLIKINAVCEMETGDPQGAVRTLRDARVANLDSFACRYVLVLALTDSGEFALALALLCHVVVAEAPGTEYATLALEIKPDLERLLQHKQTA